jgi:KaiC/GvpD/RAD55 family RecA-like ATPase
MDLDKSFVFSLLQEDKDKLADIVRKNFRADLLEGDGLAAFTFVIDFYAKHQVMPSVGAVEGRLGLVLDPVTEPVDFWVGELRNRYAFGACQDVISQANTALLAGDPRQAVDLLYTNSRQTHDYLHTSDALLQSLPGLSESGQDWYERIRNGERGIPFPWPSITDTTMGIWPEDLILFVARGGVGKSFAAILIAREAWLQGKKVLFLTTEMSQLAVALRFTAIHLQLDYGKMRRGELGVFEEQRWKDALPELQKDERWQIVGGDFDFRVETLWAYVDDFRPDLLVVDGLYLLKTDERSEKKNERAANVYDDLKRGAKRFKIGILGTTQFNRQVKVSSANPDIANIAQTDAAGWNADAAYALGRTDSQKKMRRMSIKPLKIREGDMFEVECHWDFERMDFSECQRVTHTPPGGPGGPAGPSGGGSPPSGPSSGDSGDADILKLF